jgi:hypothetical protein
MPSTISAGTTAGTAIAVAGDTTGNLAFQTNGTTTAMTINTSQNVGIGTSSPTEKLDVRGQVSGGNGTIKAGLSWSTRAEVGALTSHDLGLLANGSTQAVLKTNGDFQFNSGYGSSATAYGCRAWVNFNGTGTVAIRASGNVTSITDNGTGDYTINFTASMPDVNYATIGSASTGASDFRSVVPAFGPGWVYSTTQVRIGSAFQTGLSDCANIYVAVFR